MTKISYNRCDQCHRTAPDAAVRINGLYTPVEGWTRLYVDVNRASRTSTPLDFCSLSCLRAWARDRQRSERSAA